MAIRKIRVEGDSILSKAAKPVTEVTDKTLQLIGDMLDTMYKAGGVGLAAPQVGVLKRIVVVDVTEEGDSPIVLINPEIIETEGTQTGSEACLSVPGKSGTVTRPNFVRLRAFDRELKPFETEGTGFLARAFMHELEHLDGILYTSRVEGELVVDEDKLQVKD